MHTQKERSGLYELTDAARAELTDSKYYNNDLAPTSLSKRSWNTYHISSLWICMSVCLPAFALASSLVALGLSPWLSVLNVVIGNLIVLVPLLLNAHPGTKYGIPFPVFSRMTFGAIGAHVPALLRAITACGWNALQSWIGAAAIVSMVSSFAPSFQDIPQIRIICFIVFLILVCWIASGGSTAIKIFEAISAPILIMLSFGLFLWSLLFVHSGGAEGISYSFNDVIRTAANEDLIKSNGGFWFVFLGGLSGNIAFWAIMALSIPDFSRYAISQRAQIRGLLYGMPMAMAVCAFIGAFFAQATFLVGITDVNGNPVFDPTEILHHLSSPFATFIVSVGVVIATITTNVAAHVVASANAFSNLSPKRINYAAGVIISCVIAVVFQPWHVLDSADGYIFSWLNVLGGILAPVAAIFIADYHLVKKRNLDVMALYQGHEGRYWYQNGWNIRALLSWVCGWVFPMLGNTVMKDSEVFTWISANGYFVGFLIGLSVYTLLMKSETSSLVSEEVSKKLTVHDHL